MPKIVTHPVATGNAWQTVQKHTEKAANGLTMFASWFCPYVQRLWIALELKGVDYQYVEINPYDKSPEFLALNPRGLVPTLVTNGTPLYESAICVQFLEEAFPSAGIPLLPKDPVARAHARIWSDHIDKNIVPHLYKILMKGDDEEVFKTEGDAVAKGLYTWAGAFVGDGPFFAGDTPSFPDVMLAPFATRFELLSRGYTLPIEEGDAQWGKVAAWLDAIKEHPAVLATCSDKEQFIKMYESYVSASE